MEVKIVDQIDVTESKMKFPHQNANDYSWNKRSKRSLSLSPLERTWDIHV